MWICPKCGRTFKKQNQGHFCGKAPGTFDGYIEAQPEEMRKYLKENSTAGGRGTDLMEYADFLEGEEYHPVVRPAKGLCPCNVGSRKLSPLHSLVMINLYHSVSTLCMYMGLTGIKK